MKKTSHAFTLIESLLALALGGMVITCAAMMLMTFMQLWIDQEKGEDFTGQVDNVTRFLNTYLRTPPAIPSEPPVAELSFRKLDKEAVSQEPGLTFWFRKLPPFIEDPNQKLRCPAMAQLLFKKDRGLYLLLQALPAKHVKESEASVVKAKNDAVSKTVLLSPLVTNLEYGYYNVESNQWKFSDKLQNDEKDSQKVAFPDCIKVTFKSSVQKTVVSTIPLKPDNQAIPTF